MIGDIVHRNLPPLPLPSPRKNLVGFLIFLVSDYMYWALPVPFHNDIRKQAGENKRKEASAGEHIFTVQLAWHSTVLSFTSSPVSAFSQMRKREKNAQQHVNSFGNYCGKMSHLLSWCSLKRQ